MATNGALPPAQVQHTLMLVDLLLSVPVGNVAANRERGLRERLIRASKFVLSPDFAAAAEEVGENLKLVADALPHCRVPYRFTWFEVAQQHRPRFAASGVHVPEIQRIPTRIGFLLEATSDDYSTFRAYQFWELKDMPGFAHAGLMCMIFDPKRFTSIIPGETAMAAMPKPPDLSDFGQSPEWLAAAPEVRAKIENATRPAPAPYFDLVGFTSTADAETLKLMHTSAIADWSGEVIYVLSVLALLNTLNISETTPVSYGKLNKARAKAGKPALVDHHTLSIHPRIRRHMVHQDSGNSHGHRQLRAHLCRGHWKVRKSGIFFWRGFWRADPNRGIIHKTYRLD